MSTVQLSCPHCAGLFSMDSSLAGQQVSCPLCHAAVMTPPMPDQSPSPATWSPTPQFEAPTNSFLPPGYSPPAPAPEPQAGGYAAPSSAPLQVNCPFCSGPFQVLPEMSGQQVVCPHCQQQLVLPEFGRPNAPEPQTPPPAPFEAPPLSEPPKPSFNSVVPGRPTSAAAKQQEKRETAVGGKAQPRLSDLLPPGMSAEAPQQQPVPQHQPAPQQQPAPKSSDQKATPGSASQQPAAYAYPPGFEPPSSKPAEPASAPKQPEPKRSTEQEPKPRGDKSPDVLEKPSTKVPEKSKPRNDDLLPPGAEVDRGANKSDSPEQPVPTHAAEMLPPSSGDDTLLPPGAETPVPAAADDSLLPPGADTAPVATAATPSASRPTNRVADDLLPPGAEEVPAGPLKQVVLPTAGKPDEPRGKAADGSILIPTADGGQVAVREPVKTISAHGEEVELRQRTPEERAARRFRKNLVIWTLGILLVGITMYILLVMGPM
ncbi:MAG: hypothetical protein KDA38_10495 [Planctomycetales bacterium]|nr:hypothetical protein [Planctomycetales bacterium]